MLVDAEDIFSCHKLISDITNSSMKYDEEGIYRLFLETHPDIVQLINPRFFDLFHQASRMDYQLTFFEIFEGRNSKEAFRTSKSMFVR